MGLTESGPILETVRFVNLATFEWRGTGQSVYMPCYVLISIIKLMY